MQRPPRPPSESLFARGLGLHALLIGLLMAGLVLGAQAWFVRAESAAWQTVAFTALCFAQLGHVLAIRSEETSLLALGPATNRPLLVTVVLTVMLQLAVVYVPELNTLFHTVPLNPQELGVAVACAIVILLTVELEKWVRRGWPHRRRSSSIGPR
jgi:Ca2+-transporting ATPase